MEEESIAQEEERVAAGEGEPRKDVQSPVAADISRKEKRKERKKLKRRQLRREIAEKEREEEEKKLNDPEEQRRAMELEEQEKQRMERERKEFEERERMWLEEMEKKRKEEEMRRAQEEEEELKRLQAVKEDECNEDDDWEYVEEGPAEIIWKGNEIIVRKRKVKVPKKNADQQSRNEASDRPTSNPLPPQTEAFAMASAEQLLENVAQQVPNFGTEQDKAHCPFHLKTGACRFGQRCSRVHFYPDKACTLLMKNMYNGPGLAREQDEGLEVQCEYVNVTRWKVAICGEYMKSRLKECSRGSACNFIHCFRNPGGDYEWADWDKPPPRYWVKEMAGLFGYSYDSEVMDRDETESMRKSKRKITPDSYRFHKTRSKSRDIDRSHVEENRHRYHRNQVSHSDRGLSDKKSEPSPDLPERKIKSWDYDSDEFSEENRKRHSHMESSSRHQGRKRSVDNREDAKESHRKKEEERRVHPKNKSSRHRSSSLDDYNGTHDTDDSDSSERHPSHKRRLARKSDEETETGKSKSRREKSGRGSRDRSRSSGTSVERNFDVERLRTRENRCSSVGYYSGHDHIEEDRWKPDSPNREQTSP